MLNLVSKHSEISDPCTRPFSSCPLPIVNCHARTTTFPYLYMHMTMSPISGFWIASDNFPPPSSIQFTLDSPPFVKAKKKLVKFLPWHVSNPFFCQHTATYTCQWHRIIPKVYVPARLTRWSHDLLVESKGLQMYELIGF